MDWSAEKIDVAKLRLDEVDFALEDFQQSNGEEISGPLRGVLMGLLMSVPIWAAIFILVKFF
ncbi:hypothetical protein CA233_22205 [Sphingomonas sp. ABOLD]|uniref:Tetrahydromethanopterin S-methyltransferase n=1 Tax=Sphingomonas trueperi TaxID=53317 RepID=A0A7X5Y2R5_9SPHN|nr:MULTISPECIES: hypothetical protein [Sphingomonas]NJC00030.1 hypothetical protein [Sphingomonas trueperi]RSV32957.1 hypothetical protein CA234_22990 [Sphingomonas sp. ABOLE]RSV37281.1 hypothetical protein CA233_22205 [Sphingomonas sp. ABOLD]